VAAVGRRPVYASLSSNGSAGSLRRRLPVAANIAFMTAGTMADVPGSPIPRELSVFERYASRWAVFRSSAGPVRVEVGLFDSAILQRDLSERAAEIPRPRHSAPCA